MFCFWNWFYKAAECCGVMGEFPSFTGCAPHPGRGGGGGNKGPFDGGQRRERPHCTLTQNSAGQMGAPLNWESNWMKSQKKILMPLPKWAWELENSVIGKEDTLKTDLGKSWRDRGHRLHFLYSTMTYGCFCFGKSTLTACPHWAVLIPARDWERDSKMQYSLSIY